jgi:hypothetical protein
MAHAGQYLSPLRPEGDSPNFAHYAANIGAVPVNGYGYSSWNPRRLRFLGFHQIAQPIVFQALRMRTTSPAACDVFS